MFREVGALDEFELIDNNDRHRGGVPRRARTLGIIWDGAQRLVVARSGAPSPLSGIYLLYTYNGVRGVGIRFINVKRGCLRLTLFAPPLSPFDFETCRCRSVRDTINTSISLHGVAYNARKGPRPSGSRISDAIGSYLGTSTTRSIARCLSRPGPAPPPSLNLLRAPAEKRLTAPICISSGRSTSFVCEPVAVARIYLSARYSQKRTPFYGEPDNVAWKIKLSSGWLESGWLS